jgi:hypothetical protein
MTFADMLTFGGAALAVVLLAAVWILRRSSLRRGLTRR